MNIFEYLNIDCYTDDYGNGYIDSDNLVLCYLHGLLESDGISYVIPKDLYEKIINIDISIPTDDDSIRRFEYIRRPYYRMRGKSVTSEQAFDIIRKTDNFFRTYIEEISEHPDYVGCVNFDNWLIDPCHFPKGYGWVHTDGTIGCNSITQKYPTLDEILVELVNYLVNFPYLDAVFSFTDYDEVLPNEGDFIDYASVGFYIHDNKIEVLSKEENKAKYIEYSLKYGVDEYKFESDYYEKRKKRQVTRDYLSRCIESYGLNTDKVLNDLPSYVKSGLKEFWR